MNNNNGAKIKMGDTAFTRAMVKAGYKNITSFANDCGIMPQTANKYLNGTCKPKVDRMLLFAEKLNLPIIDVIAMWYPDEVEHYKQTWRDRTTELIRNIKRTY